VKLRKLLFLKRTKKSDLLSVARASASRCCWLRQPGGFRPLARATITLFLLGIAKDLAVGRLDLDVR